MRRVIISSEATADIDQIAAYTGKAWGWRQADRYLGELEDSFQLLAKNPGIGRACDAISSGLQRHEHGKHVVFYRLRPGGIRIVRVLHQQMIPASSRFEK